MEQAILCLDVSEPPKDWISAEHAVFAYVA